VIGNGESVNLQVGLYLPMASSIGNRASGMRRLAYELRGHLERRRDVAIRQLDPWVDFDPSELDVVHAFGFEPGMNSVLRGRNFAVVAHPIHDSQIPASRYRLAIRAGTIVPRLDTIPAQKAALLRAADAVVTLSEDERARIVDSFGLDEGRVVVVHCGVDPPRLVSAQERRDVLARLSLPPRFALALCDYGAVRKNLCRLAEALTGTKIPLVLAGHASAGPALDRIRELAGRSRNILLRGPIEEPDVPALFSACAVYCQPSIEEGAGFSAMQAATYGATVVATRVGGIPEHLGPDARYVPPTNVAAIRAAVTEAWAAPVDKRVGDFVLQQRTWDRAAERLTDVYRQAIERHAS
jgi:glycosyltransferase involved in cell wall biosynthesis